MGATICFYGRLASFSKREAERFARESGYRVAANLRENVAIVVLGEGEATAQLRARLAREFDERSNAAFENGALEILSESEFFERAASSRVASLLRTPSERAVRGYTPAAVAELVGTSVDRVRRWERRGLLSPVDPLARLPLFSTRETLVAKRLVFLFSTGLSEDQLVKRVFSFGARAFAAENDAEELPLFQDAVDPFDLQTIEKGALSLKDSPFDVGAILLKSTLASDGRDLLFLGEDGPIDRRGQRRFDFSAFPTDGTFETPESAPLSSDEEQIDLAERLSSWNAASTDATGRPAFLQLFDPDAQERERNDAEPIDLDGALASFARDAQDAASETTPSDAFVDARGSRRTVELCDEAWRLEREGYWEESARVYRCAALSGGFDAVVSFRLGKVLYLLGDYSAARERFYAALESDEDFVDARVELGKTFAALGERNDALAAFQGALEDRPNDPALRFELGKLYLSLDRKGDAADEFQFVAENVDDPELAEDARACVEAIQRNAIYRAR